MFINLTLDATLYQGNTLRKESLPSNTPLGRYHHGANRNICVHSKIEIVRYNQSEFPNHQNRPEILTIQKIAESRLPGARTHAIGTENSCVDKRRPMAATRAKECLVHSSQIFCAIGITCSSGCGISESVVN